MSTHLSSTTHHNYSPGRCKTTTHLEQAGRPSTASTCVVSGSNITNSTSCSNITNNIERVTSGEKLGSKPAPPHAVCGAYTDRNANRVQEKGALSCVTPSHPPSHPPEKQEYEPISTHAPSSTSNARASSSSGSKVISQSVGDVVDEHDGVGGPIGTPLRRTPGTLRPSPGPGNYECTLSGLQGSEPQIVQRSTSRVASLSPEAQGWPSPEPFNADVARCLVDYAGVVAGEKALPIKTFEGDKQADMGLMAGVAGIPPRREGTREQAPSRRSTSCVKAYTLQSGSANGAGNGAGNCAAWNCADDNGARIGEGFALHSTPQSNKKRARIDDLDLGSIPQPRVEDRERDLSPASSISSSSAIE